MKKLYLGPCRSLLILFLLLGTAVVLPAQTITLGTPSVGNCTLDGNVPTSTITIEVSWDVSAGDVVEVELQDASVISTNPVLLDASTAGSNQTVTFTALADGSTGASIQAQYRTPITGGTSGTQNTAAFDVASNTCTGGTATICTDGTNSVTLTPSADLDPSTPMVVWYAIDDNGVETEIPAANYGTNDEITVTYNGTVSGITGVTNWSDLFYTNASGDPEARFYFTAVDENGCAGELCVPVTVTAEVCYDLALTKVEASTGPYIPGSTVEFTIEVTNQGTRDAFDISVVDYFTNGELVFVDVDEANPVFSYTPSDNGITDNGDGTFLINELAAGESVAVDISFTVSNSFMETSIVNAAEISAFFKDAAGTDPAADEDSTPDANNDEDGPGAELTNNDIITDIQDGTPQDDDPVEDDYDPEQITVTQTFDLALVKTEVSTGPYIPGNDAEDDVTFSITVHNQGTLDATNIEVTDYIPTGLNFTSVNTTATWSGTLGTITDDGGGVYTISALEAGETVAVEMTFEVTETFTGTSLINYAEITDATNALGQPDADSTPDDNMGDDESDPTVDDKITDGDNGSLQDDDADSDDYDGDEIELVQQVALGNIVFSDVDGDGIFDAEDMGIANVTVELYASTDDPGNDAPLASTTTDANGYYIFDGLDPDDYIVYIPGTELADGGDLDNLQTSIPEGVDDTNDDNADENGQNTLVNGGVASTVISLGLNAEPTGEAGQQTGTYAGDLDDDNVNLTVDFGFTPEYRIGNLVWEDVDNDGAAETGELGIAGVTVALYEDNGDGILNTADDVLIVTTTTDADGKYEFTGLYQGDYFVVIPDAANTASGEPLFEYFSSTNGEEADPNTDGDNNDNGTLDATAATNGVDGIAAAFVTVGTGDSEPTNEQLRSDDATDDDTADGSGGTVPDNRSNVTVDFGFYQQLSLGDVVFFDTNNDGVFDADGVDGTPGNLDDEYGIEGVEVRLLDGTGASVEDPNNPGNNYVVTTDPNGNYLFEDLDPGDYIVEIVTPAGYRSSTGANAATGPNEDTAPDPDDDTNDDDNGDEETATTIRSQAITLTSNGEPTDDGDTDANTNLTVDFGIVGYSLGNYVWLDADNSGDVNGTEMGIDGVTVRLLNGDDTEYDTDPNTSGIQPFDVTTADGGFYFFGNLPEGDYKVQVLGSNFTTASALDNLMPSTGAAEEDDPNLDGDQNDNGLGDLPTITDLTTNGVVSDVVTLGDFAEPTGEATTVSGVDGQDPVSNSDVLSNLTVDFGFTPSMSVGSTVFADVDNNGMLDGGEVGIDGVTVELYDADNDMLVATDVTSGGGNYYFEGLPEGDYYIVLPNVSTELATTPKSSEPTVDDPDAAGDVDGDDNGIQTNAGDAVESGIFTLEADTEPTDGTAGTTDEEGGPGANLDDADDNNGNMTIDFGFYQPVDYGDLPDNYSVVTADNGPSHVIIAGLQIGATIDDELDGQESADADGDDNDSSGDDEDGVDIAAQTYKAGTTVNIPVVVTNDTNDEATLYAFVDWNNDGDFGDLGEAVTVTVPANSGTTTVLAEFTIPSEADGTDINSTVGARFRLTTDDLGAVAADGSGADAASLGAATDGEVEDYVLDISCPTGNCFDVQIQINEN
mgnify:CR=1 FL=1